jgi:2-polyprenyl-3-methyl-5-hydroxy-6-metoxy-1,4-benzoquinol methylase
MGAPAHLAASADLEHVACNYCGADDAKVVYDFATYQIVECRRCGLAYTTPRLSRKATEAELYGPEYWRDYEQQYEAGLPAVRAFAARWLERLREYAPVKERWRLCELGPGLGGFLTEAQAEGHEVHGLELSEHAVGYARDRLGVDTIHRGLITQLPELGLPPLDVIVMLAVIEHLHDPMAALRMALDQLAPGGVLLLSTGVWRSFNHRIAGTAWSIIAPDAHLYYFSKRTMKACLERAGFDVVYRTTNGALVNPLTKRRRMVLLFNNRLVAWSGIPRLTARFALGDEMFVIARRA